MSEPFLAEIRIVGFNFPPRGWLFCDGQILPISQFQALYSLLGTTYGGDGRTTFALPDLRGRYPMHVSSAHPLGQRGGEQTHTLSAAEMPSHDHVLQASAATADQPLPTGALLAEANDVYTAPPADTGLRSDTLTSVGGGQAHSNLQPYLGIHYCIATTGLFPSRN